MSWDISGNSSWCSMLQLLTSRRWDQACGRLDQMVGDMGGVGRILLRIGSWMILEIRMSMANSHWTNIHPEALVYPYCRSFPFGGPVMSHKWFVNYHALQRSTRILKKSHVPWQESWDFCGLCEYSQNAMIAARSIIFPSRWLFGGQTLPQQTATAPNNPGRLHGSRSAKGCLMEYHGASLWCIWDWRNTNTRYGGFHSHGDTQEWLIYKGKSD